MVDALQRLHGKTAVITGAGRRGGLGAAIAARLAAEGAAIVLSDIPEPIEPGVADPSYAREIDKLAAGIGGNVSTFICDVRDWNQVQALAAHAVSAHGGLEIWVNNAGIGSIMKPLLTLQPEDWTKVIDVNLTGAFFGLRAAADVMVAQKRGGRIINIASQAAKSGFAHAQAYTASKHGLVGLVRSAAIELGPHGITVNNLPSITSFRVFKTTGILGGDAPAPYAYVETIDIADMDGFWKDVATPVMQDIAAKFSAMADVVFMTTEEIEA